MRGISRAFFVFGCLNLAVAIGLGAAGAHALRGHLASSDPGGWFATALQYHQIHSLGLVLAGFAAGSLAPSRWFVGAGWMMTLGILLFCGGLYLLSLFNLRIVPGGIPAGGMAFVLAWVFMAIGGWRHIPERRNAASAIDHKVL